MCIRVHPCRVHTYDSVAAARCLLPCSLRILFTPPFFPRPLLLRYIPSVGISLLSHPTCCCTNFFLYFQGWLARNLRPAASPSARHLGPGPAWLALGGRFFSFLSFFSLFLFFASINVQMSSEKATEPVAEPVASPVASPGTPTEAIDGEKLDEQLHLQQTQSGATNTSAATRTTTRHSVPEKPREWYKNLNPLRWGAIPPVPEERQASREYGAGFFSRLTFQWMAPMMSVGARYLFNFHPDW